jgi:hypothetical protein
VIGNDNNINSNTNIVGHDQQDSSQHNNQNIQNTRFNAINAINATTLHIIQGLSDITLFQGSQTSQEAKLTKPEVCQNTCIIKMSHLRF